MSEPEEQIGDVEEADIDVQAEDTQTQSDVGNWGKKLRGLTWRIDVPVSSDDSDADDKRSQPHAVVELVFSSHDPTGKEV